MDSYLQHYILVKVIIMAVGFFVVIPILKTIWKFLTKKKAPESIATVPKSVRQATVANWRALESTALKWWQDNMRDPASFLAVETPKQAVRFYSPKEIPDFLNSAIISGAHSSLSNSIIFAKGEDGKWTENSQPLQNIINEHFKLKLLYRPIWAYALLGLKWGVIVGMALKLLDTALVLLSVEPGAGLCFLAAVGVCFVPRVGIVGVIVLSFVMSQFYEANFFIVGMSAALTGALLGCLPGMALGGIIAIGKKKSFLLAPDAKAEEDGNFLKAVFLPLAGGLLLIGLYVFVFNPWLMQLL